MKTAFEHLASVFRRSGGAASRDGLRRDEVPVLAKPADTMPRRTLFDVAVRRISGPAEADGTLRRIFIVSPSILEAIAEIYVAHPGVKVMSITAVAGTYAPADLIIDMVQKPPLPYKR